MTKQKAKQTRKSAKVPALGVRKSAPAATSRRVVTSAHGPSITRSSAGCRIKHREFVTAVVLPSTEVAPYSGTYKVWSWSVNPGLSALFPWLSPVANQYELYRFHSLKFRYVARTGTSTGGTVRMAFDHDAMDDDPPSRDVFMAYAGAVADTCWRDIDLDVPASRLNLGMPNGRYTRLGVHPIEDLKTYDAGKFLLAVTGWGTAQEIGELLVEYDVELLVPQIRSSGTSGVLKSGGANSPTSVSYDRRVIAIVDRIAPVIAGVLPAILEEKTEAGTGAIANFLKFVAPFTGLVTCDIKAGTTGVGSDPAIPVLEVSEDPSHTAVCTEKPDLSFSRPGTTLSAGQTFRRWLVDVAAGTILKLSSANSNPFPLAGALLAYQLMGKSAFSKYEL